MESPCPLCLTVASDIEGHLVDTCEYNIASITAIFRESIPEAVNQFRSMPPDECITARDLVVALDAIIERQDKLAMILQFRMAKLALRAVGSGLAAVDESEDAAEEAPTEPQSKAKTRWSEV